MHIVRKIFKTLLFALLGVFLLAAGVLVALYSPWVQDTLREAVVRRFSSGSDMELRVRSLSLRPPLRLRAGGVALIQRGDSLMAADSVAADVELLPLLRGEVRLDDAMLLGAYYRQGAPDSAMCITLRAAGARLRPASVSLSSMDINVEDADLLGASVDLLMNPDTATPSPEASPADTSAMTIALRRVRLDDFSFRMRMLPTIDSLGAHIHSGTLRDGRIDMARQSITLRSMQGSGLSASYIAPDSATVAATPVVPDSPSASAPWTVSIRDIAFDRSAGLYATRGVQPQPGLDFGYISVDSLQLAVHDFFNRGPEVCVPMRIGGRERCGVRLDAAGTLRVDSAALRLDSFALSTPWTVLEFDYMMGMGDIATDPSLPVAVNAKGHVGTPDMRLMFPAFAPWLAGLPDSGATLDIDAGGTMGSLALNRFRTGVNGCVWLDATGRLDNVMQPDRMGADLSLDGRIADAAPIARAFLSPADMKSVRIPAMTLAGNVRMRDGSDMAARLTARTGGGSLALDGSYAMRGDAYRAEVDADAFPINAFMPLLGVGSVTGRVEASGHGFDFFSPSTALTCRADVESAEYAGHRYTGIAATAVVADGKADVSITSADPSALADVSARGNLAGDTLSWELYADAHRIDLKGLGMGEAETTLSGRFSGAVDYTMQTGWFGGRLGIDRMQMRDETSEFDISDVDVTFAADTTVRASLANRDFLADLDIRCPLDTLLARTDSISAAVASVIASRRLDAERIQRAVPQMSLRARGGSDNFVNDILAASKMRVDSVALDLANTRYLTMNGAVLGVSTQSLRIDTLNVDVAQFGSNLIFNAGVANRPGTLDQFARVQLSGLATDNIAGVRVHQQNIQGKTGYDIGLQAQLSDSVIRASVMPLDPTIGYRPWTVNSGNFVSYSLADGHVDADVHMQGDDSSLAIFTEHDAGHTGQEDLVVRVGDIHVQDWIALNPFAPPVKGDVSAEIRLNYNDARQLNGRGTVDLSKFFYDGQRVADIHADADVSTAPGGVLTATADIAVDGRRAITLRGALNDSTLTSPMNLDLRVISLPLAVANPFLGASTGRMNGTLNGSLDVQGTTDKPTFNGWLALDSASVFLAMTATDYRITADTVPVVDSHATLRNFAVYGANNNPLMLNGTVDISDMFSPQIDLALKATDMQVVNSRRAARGADIYGKAFVSLDATARGNFSFMRVNADLTLLSGTNVTYVMPDAVAALQARNTDEMVRFVNFMDSTAVASADSVVRTGMALLLDASVTFQTNAVVGVDLSADGKNRAQVQPVGELSYSLTPMSDDGRLTGRLDLEDGYVRYTPPFMSEKNFAFRQGSYVAFNGNMMNPTLNVHAVDVIKANVTQTGQNSRLVNFNVGLSVTGTLDQMKVAFDLSTDDDITVSNELQAMSPEQRANQAMNMLLYNVYTGPGTRGNSNIGGNFLFSFLESKINSWAANNIKGVDISFGIDQYNRTVDGNTSATTSYSYQVSKSLFNDRFKIVVGGNYSTDANADENFSQNLINDISFEYFLNRAQTMYFKLFRHTGYESILEGEITRTGVGFVYKHKLNSLRDIFRRSRRRDAAADPELLNNDSAGAKASD